MVAWRYEFRISARSCNVVTPFIWLASGDPLVITLTGFHKGSTAVCIFPGHQF